MDRGSECKRLFSTVVLRISGEPLNYARVLSSGWLALLVGSYNARHASLPGNVRTIGMIGGLGPYYRLIIARYRARRPDGGYPHVVINSLDASDACGCSQDGRVSARRGSGQTGLCTCSALQQRRGLETTPARDKHQDHTAKQTARSRH